MTGCSKQNESCCIFVYDSWGRQFNLNLVSSTQIACENCVTVEVPRYPRYEKIYKYMTRKYDWDRNFTIGLVNEYAKFLELKIWKKDCVCELLSPPPLIERVWNEHMKDSKVYNHMCQTMHQMLNVTGEFEFIQNVRNMPRRLATTKAAYRSRFGVAPDEVYWDVDAEPLAKRPHCKSPNKCLKRQICEWNGLAPSRQCLTSDYHDLLENDRTLWDCNIQSGRIIFVYDGSLPVEVHREGLLPLKERALELEPDWRTMDVVGDA